MRYLAVLATACLVGCEKRTEAARDVDPATCAGCHPAIAASYRQTGMGRSFSTTRKLERASYYHKASERHYAVETRAGRFYQRRHQRGPDGAVTNVLEKEIHYILGSGNHARSFLHRKPDGSLVQLPLGWYAAKGGFWAMSPGYDRPDHKDFRRAITADCLFCHNGYPRGGKLAEGIDCQRCHGPGSLHVGRASAGATAADIKAAIINPKRLGRERELEVCMQCHLETSSRPLPYSIVRYGRDVFSYRPGEPLADYILHFDRAAADDRFEIAHAAYRLRKSACFTKSGMMTCTTCHNPHRPANQEDYTRTCLGCHAQPHTASRDCVSCHMPKRRSDDVVHVAMTDHFIRRRKPARDLLAPLAEVAETESTAYRGPVVPYYPAQAGELYEAAAQVKEGSNIEAGIGRLRMAIEKYRPPEAGFYHDLAEAYAKNGRLAEAIPWYDEALKREPGRLPTIRNLGDTLARTGRLDRAGEVLRWAPRDAAALNNLGDVYLRSGRRAEAAGVLRQAVALDPDLPQAHGNLGLALDGAGAIAAFREAIRLQPDYALAHNNLANALNASGDAASAESHFREAIRLRLGYEEAHYNYGSALAAWDRMREAEAQLLKAPRLPESHNNLGNIYAMRGDHARATQSFRKSVTMRPDFAQARLNLGVALASEGKLEEAAAHFRTASQSPDAAVRQAALQALEAIARR